MLLTQLVWLEMLGSFIAVCDVHLKFIKEKKAFRKTSSLNWRTWRKWKTKHHLRMRVKYSNIQWQKHRAISCPALPWHVKLKMMDILIFLCICIVSLLHSAFFIKAVYNMSHTLAFLCRIHCRASKLLKNLLKLLPFQALIKNKLCKATQQGYMVDFGY